MSSVCICLGLPVFPKTLSVTSQGTSYWRLWAAVVAWKSYSKDMMTFFFLSLKHLLKCKILSCIFLRLHCLNARLKKSYYIQGKKNGDWSSVIDFQPFDTTVSSSESKWTKTWGKHIYCVVSLELVDNCHWVTSWRGFQILSDGGSKGGGCHSQCPNARQMYRKYLYCIQQM